MMPLAPGSCNARQTACLQALEESWFGTAPQFEWTKAISRHDDAQFQAIAANVSKIARRYGVGPLALAHGAPMLTDMNPRHLESSTEGLHGSGKSAVGAIVLDASSRVGEDERNVLTTPAPDQRRTVSRLGGVGPDTTDDG